MSGHQVFTSRLKGRPLLDSEGLTIGRIRDVVILPSDGNDPPRALGLIATLQRRRIFVNLGQVTEISVDGAHLLGGAGELDRFTRRAGEMLADFVTAVTAHLQSGSRIRMSGLGTLEVKKREARVGRNPATGEAIQIMASKKVTFRPAKELKEAV